MASPLALEYPWQPEEAFPELELSDSLRRVEHSSPTPDQLRSQINSDPIIQALLEWHLSETEGHRVDEDTRIIDVNLLPQFGLEYPASRVAREETLSKLRGFLAELPVDTSDQRALRATLDGSIYFIRALNGERIPFEEYVQHISGITPMEFTGYEIEAQKKRVAEARKLVSDNDLKPLEPQQVEEAFRSFLDEQIPGFLKFLGFPDIKVNYRLEFENVDKARLARADTDNDGNISFTVNTHPRHKWSVGRAQSVALHEVMGHIIQDLTWQEQIRRGELDPSLGITMEFTPFTYQAEGIANTFQRFLPAELQQKIMTPAIAFDIERNHLRRMVQHNAHIWANHGESIDDLIQYVQGELVDFLDPGDPLLKPEVVRSRIEEDTVDPISRSYSLVYPQSEAFLRTMAEQCTPDEGAAFLRDVYRHPYMPDDLHRWLENYRAGHANLQREQGRTAAVMDA